MHKNSTDYERQTVRRFRTNPVGFTVKLADGREAEVKGFRRTPKGDWYQVKFGRSRKRPWIPAADVQSVVYWTAEVKSAYRGQW